MSRSEKSSAKNRQIRLIRLLFLLLPDEIVEFVRQILFLLKSVADQSATNKMTVENLGKIFGPLLLCPKAVNLKIFLYIANSFHFFAVFFLKLSPQEIHNNADAVAVVVSFMIEHSDQIFTVKFFSVLFILQHEMRHYSII